VRPMTATFLRAYRLDIAIIAVIFAVALIPRISDLGTFLTADEKNWMGRSFEFVRAFHDLRFNDMLQTTHPGVTTLWVSGLAIMAKSIMAQVSFTNTNLIYFVKTSQFSIAIVNALIIPAIYALLVLVLRNRLLAAASALFILFDPFIVGYSRVVHVDALMGSLLTLAVLSSMLYAKYLSRPWLIASAVLSTLAILTKVPAIFIAPFMLVALAVYHPRALLSLHFLKDRAKDAVVWILFGVVITLIIWPALLWVPNPAGNVMQLNKDISTAAVTPHDSNEEYGLDITHYPYALLARSTPVTLIGALFGCEVLVWFSYKKRIPKEMLLVVVYLFGFVLMMTLGAKKGDRYIVPAFFALDILAAYGLVWVGSLLTSPSPSFVRRGMRWFLPLTKGEQEGVSRGGVIIALLSTLYLLYIIISYHPYELAYSNPFFRDNLSQELGWGEGLDQVAVWLNKNHPNAVVASWYPEELGTFTSAVVLHINAHTQNPVNYIVLYQNMFGRAPDYYANDFIDEYYKKQNPVFVVKIAGKEYAWVYEKPSYTSSIGELNSQTIAVQEVSVDHNDLAGFQFLPATHFGKSDTGVFSITVSKTLNGPAIFATNIPVTEVKDTAWQQVIFPDSIQIAKDEHLFVNMRGVGTADPYPSIRYSQADIRTTPIYISRTGNPADAKQKTGTLGIQLLFHDTEGKISTELEEKLLK